MKFACGLKDRFYLVCSINNDAQKQQRREDRSEDIFLFRDFRNVRDGSCSPHERSLPGSRCPRVQGARRRDDRLIFAGETTARRVP